MSVFANRENFDMATVIRDPNNPYVRRMLDSLRALASIIVGYATIVVFAIVFQDLLFGGLSLPASALHELAIGGFMTAVGAFVGGLLLTLVAGRAALVAALILASLLMIEGVYIYFGGMTPNPLWFDIVASASLAVGLLLGYWTRRRQAGAVRDARSGAQPR